MDEMLAGYAGSRGLGLEGETGGALESFPWAPGHAAVAALLDDDLADQPSRMHLSLAAIAATATRNVWTVGYPLPGETIGRRHFDGNEAFAIFPGDLPANPETALRHPHAQPDDVRFVRFRPPDPVPLPGGGFGPFPNIRLDRALQALIGDGLT